MTPAGAPVGHDVEGTGNRAAWVQAGLLVELLAAGLAAYVLVARSGLLAFLLDGAAIAALIAWLTGQTNRGGIDREGFERKRQDLGR